MKAQLKQIYDRWVARALDGKKEEKKLCYLMSFKGNNNGWLDEVIQSLDIPMSILYTKEVTEEAHLLKERYPFIEILPLTPGYLFFKKTLPSIAKSRWLLCDNYFPLLASVSSTTQRIGMIWHANGAIKKFGACDPKNKERTSSENHRFHAVYQHYTDFFVGSDAMAQVFEKSYEMSKDKERPIGFVRSDKLASADVSQLRATFFKQNPSYVGKQIVLYAPTYREDEIDYPFDATWITENHPEMAVIERYHPHVNKASTKIDGTYEMLLAATDICITDYSSIPFDYTLLHPEGRLIFYQYDLAMYRERFGLESLFEKSIPGPVVQTKDELQAALLQPIVSFEAFNKQWNTYNDGCATQRLIQYIKEDLA